MGAHLAAHLHTAIAIRNQFPSFYLHGPYLFLGPIAVRLRSDIDLTIHSGVRWSDRARAASGWNGFHSDACAEACHVGCNPVRPGFVFRFELGEVFDGGSAYSVAID